MVEGLLEEALNHLQVGELAEAISTLRDVLSVDDNISSAHGMLGSALMGHAKFEEAIGHFRRVLEIDPEDAKAHGNLGLALMQSGSIGMCPIYYYSQSVSQSCIRDRP